MISIISWYNHLKTGISYVIPETHHNLHHIYVGFLAFLLSGVFLRRKYSEPVCLLPGLVISILMEALDLGDDWITANHIGWNFYVYGFVTTNLLPLVLFLFIRFNRSKFN